MKRRQGPAAAVVEVVHVGDQAGEEQPGPAVDRMRRLFDDEDLSVEACRPQVGARSVDQTRVRDQPLAIERTEADADRRRWTRGFAGEGPGVGPDALARQWSFVAIELGVGRLLKKRSPALLVLLTNERTPSRGEDGWVRRVDPGLVRLDAGSSPRHEVVKRRPVV